ncbi:MAG: ABC transporter ATP-binding protein [Marinovum sp.]|nr:ABC transporter ATP-binding protein [Marinovum sp.]
MADQPNGLGARALTMSYGGASPVIEKLDLSVMAGKFTALIGPNGCGKSTLIKALGRLLRPTSGAVLLNGEHVNTFGAKRYARQVSSLQQSAQNPAGLTVEALVGQGRYPHRTLLAQWTQQDSAAVDRALEKTQMVSFRNAPIETLSGGQRQRAWIAMVLAQETSILLLDEPTTWLDLRYQIEILSLLNQLVSDQGLTVIAVLHDLNQAIRYAQHLIIMADGQIVSEGSAEDAIIEEVLAQVYGIEIGVFPDPSGPGLLCLPKPTKS